MNFSLNIEHLVLDPAGVAQVLKISERQLLELRRDPTFPKPRMCGANRPRWHLMAILDWVQRVSTADAGDAPRADATTATPRGRRTPRVR